MTPCNSLLEGPFCTRYKKQFCPDCSIIWMAKSWSNKLRQIAKMTWHWLSWPFSLRLHILHTLNVFLYTTHWIKILEYLTFFSRYIEKQDLDLDLHINVYIYLRATEQSGWNFAFCSLCKRNPPIGKSREYDNASQELLNTV